MGFVANIEFRQLDGPGCIVDFDGDVVVLEVWA